ncbi:MAG TPA: diguanylate cyclase, partial [Gammaproteobacteria bacterium]|nr:diguanylate cyclase [Gammaproteobacteria bacterium]
MRFNFQNRIVAYFIALVILVLLAVSIAVFFAIRQNVATQAADELRVGSRVFSRLLETRSDQLLQTVSVLSQDFGFKQAVATGDEPTIRSALLNHASRAGADVAMLLSLDGNIVTAAPSIINDGVMSNNGNTAFPLQHLFVNARGQGHAATIGVINGRVYQLVLVPVYAPLQIAWVCMGFEVNDVLAQDISQLTGLEVSFIADSPAGATVLASTLSQPMRAALDKTLTKHQWQTDTGNLVHTQTLLDEGFLLTTQGLGSDEATALYAVLQTSLAAARATYTQLQYELLAIAGFALFIALLLALLVANGVTRPVRELAVAAQRIASGDYQVSVDVKRRDELGQLATTFNQMQRDIAEREERIAYQAQHDTLTGLPNRVLAQDRLNGAIARARREQTTGAVLMLDLDRFKEINDTLGHQTGDEILRQTARRLIETVRDADTVARIGGDEFLVILEHTDREQASQVAQ